MLKYISLLTAVADTLLIDYTMDEIGETSEVVKTHYAHISTTQCKTGVSDALEWWYHSAEW